MKNAIFIDIKILIVNVGELYSTKLAEFFTFFIVFILSRSVDYYFKLTYIRKETIRVLIFRIPRP